MGSMKTEKRGTARKSGQESTRYPSGESFPENGVFGPISAGKSSGTLAGSLHVELRVLLRDVLEVKTTVLLVQCRYPPGIVTATHYWTLRRPESAPEDTLKPRPDSRVTLCLRKVRFSLKQRKPLFSEKPRNTK